MPLLDGAAFQRVRPDWATQVSVRVPPPMDFNAAAAASRTAGSTCFRSRSVRGSITRSVPLVAIVIGERLATTLWSSFLHPAGLADTQLVTVECTVQVTADVQHARRVASPRLESGLTTRVPYCESKRPIEVIGSQVVIVSSP